MARPYEALVLALLAFVGCGSPPPPEKPSILWIVVDTLRADHVPAYGYSRPTLHSIDRLVEQGVLFERAYAPQGDTTPSMATMLTGYEPWRHGLDSMGFKLPEGLRTVPEFLHTAGYETAAFVSSFVMVGEFSGLSQGFDTYDDFLSREGDYQRRAGETLALAQQWIERPRAARAADPAVKGERPFFCFVHLIDPHGPYDPPAEFADRFRSETARPIALDDIPRYQRRGGETDAQRYVDRYDDEIAYLDSQLERFFSALAASGKLDSLLVVFTADHGESLGEHGVHFEHGWNVHEETLRVPLVIRPPISGSRDRSERPHPPGIARGQRVSVPVGVIDLAPTVLAAAGIPRTGELDGVDLGPALRGESWSRKPLVARSRRARLSWAWIDGPQKIVALATRITPRAGEPGEDRDRPPANLPGNLAARDREGRVTRVQWTRYDLENDPFELRARSVPSVLRRAHAERWRGILATAPFFTARPNLLDLEERARFLAERADRPDAQEREEDLRRLRALGYLQ